MKLTVALLAVTVALRMVAADPVSAGELEPVSVQNWLDFQRNTDGSIQWKDEPRLYVPWRFENGWTFTQRVDVPYIYTNATGPGNPEGGYSGGLGDVFIEEIVETS